MKCETKSVYHGLKSLDTGLLIMKLFSFPWSQSLKSDARASVFDKCSVHTALNRVWSVWFLLCVTENGWKCFKTVANQAVNTYEDTVNVLKFPLTVDTLTSQLSPASDAEDIITHTHIMLLILFKTLVSARRAALVQCEWPRMKSACEIHCLCVKHLNVVPTAR